MWDSGKVASSTSTGVAYAGPALEPTRRYFWTVKVWDKDGVASPASETSWFETGLLQQSNWHATWIGSEPAELHAIRNSGAAWIMNVTAEVRVQHSAHSDFRLQVQLDKPIRSAHLYTTGMDDAAAWINGQQVLTERPLPPWQQLAWKTYARAEVTAQLKPGTNLLAVGITHYQTSGNSDVDTHLPMSAVLYVSFADGSTKVVTTADPGWEAQLDAPEGWQKPDANVDAWKAAEPFSPISGSDGSPTTGLPWPTPPVAALRKTFTARPKLVSARLYATALGAYKFHLNGAVVGDQILSPGWMDFREHVPHQVYDVTAQVHSGSNAVAAYLAPGWYSTPLAWLGQGNNYGSTEPALKAQLRLEYADGSVDWVSTDDSWTAAASRITFAEIYDGETEDARLEQPGWDKAGFNDAAWTSASTVPVKEPKLVAQYFQPIRIERTMTAMKITQPKPGVYIFDFGQNMSAIPNLHLSGARGQQVQLRFAEVLNADGTLYVDNLRTAKATDRFTLAGKGVETFSPLFTFHGFRYAELTGTTVAPTTATLKADVLHTDAPFTSHFSTGDSMVNSLWQIIQWGQRSNFVGVPTDCPQRDERLGWTADAQVFWRTASFNMDLTTFSQKFSSDLRGTQVNTPMYGIYAPGLQTPNPGYGAAWSDAGVIVPWTSWIQTGDTRVVDQNWDGMQAYLANILAKNPNHLWQKEYGAAFGDWLTPTITTPEDLLATAYWAYDVTLMRQMALATHRTEDAERYTALFDQIRSAFQRAYIRSDGFVGTVDHFPSIPPPTIHPTAKDKAGSTVETQTGYVLALYMGLMPDDLRSAAATRLVALIRENGMRLGTGFVGTPYLLEVLTNTGHSDVAYTLLLNRQYPSWGYLIDHGATTTWERWNGDAMRSDPSMNSYNHYAYGAVAEWLYRFGAGVDADPADAGFHHVLLHPSFDGRLGHMDYTYDSHFGPIRSAWAVVGAGTRVTWTITLPPNTTGALQTSRIRAADWTVDGRPIANALQHGAGNGDYVVPAGTYTFSANLRPAASTLAQRLVGSRQ